MASRYGEGTLYHDDARGLWVGKVELERGADGKRRRKVVKAKTKAAVLAKMRVARDRRDDGLPDVDATATVAQWLTHWCDNVITNGDLKPGTIQCYRWVCGRYLIPELGRRQLVKLTPEHIERMMTDMRARGLSPRTVGLTRTVLRIALAEAERRHRVGRNVAALTRAPKKAPTKISDALTADEASKVLDAARGDRLEALAVLVIATGLRQGEALDLRWSAVDLDDAVARVTDAKTAAGVRTIPLPARVVTALRAHRARQLAERVAADVWGDPDLVFASTVGTRLEQRDVIRWWHALTIEAGVGRRRFHATRHTAATLMLNNGVPLEVVSAILGHAGLAITADVYAKVGKGLQRDAADTMDRVLGQ